MFKDYYQILGISENADAAAIKSAYRSQALKWHPDKHPDRDVRSIMQDINEAYAILKDSQKRSRYDQEYNFFKKSHPIHSEKQQNSNRNQNDYWHEYHYDYDVKNEDLKEDIRSAREYASKLVDEFFRELKRNSKLAAEGAWKGAKHYIYALILLIILGYLIRMCASL